MSAPELRVGNRTAYLRKAVRHGHADQTHEIAEFLERKGPGRRVVFVTYQSSERLAEAVRRIRLHV